MSKEYKKYKYPENVLIYGIEAATPFMRSDIQAALKGYDIPLTTIDSENLDLMIRRAATTLGNYSNIIPDRYQKVIDMFTNGYTLGELANICGVSVTTVRNNVERLVRRVVADIARNHKQGKYIFESSPGIIPGKISPDDESKVSSVEVDDSIDALINYGLSIRTINALSHYPRGSSYKYGCVRTGAYCKTIQDAINFVKDSIDEYGVDNWHTRCKITGFGKSCRVNLESVLLKLKLHPYPDKTILQDDTTQSIIETSYSIRVMVKEDGYNKYYYLTDDVVDVLSDYPTTVFNSQTSAETLLQSSIYQNVRFKSMVERGDIISAEVVSVSVKRVKDLTKFVSKPQI